MKASEVLSQLRGLMLPHAPLEMGGQEPPATQSPGGAVGGGGLGLGAMMGAVKQNCMPSFGVNSKEGDCVIEVGSLHLSDSEDDDDSFLWETWSKSGGGSSSAGVNGERSARGRRKDDKKRIASRQNCEKQWSCYGEDGVDLSSEDSSLLSSEASSVAGGPSYPASPFQNSGSSSHRRGNVQANPQDVIEYATFLGIDPLKEPHLLQIAEDGLVAPLPDGWTEHKDPEGNIFYFHTERRVSEWQHPLDSFFKHKVEAARSKAALRKEKRRARHEAKEGFQQPPPLPPQHSDHGGNR